MEESFVVSARKYRPQGFDEVVGQEHITTTLKNAIDNNHLAQALLFCGPRGVGKTTCARILSRMINDFDDADTSNNFNIYELDAASNNSVDDIRSLVEQVRYPPQYGKYKVYIIDEVHMLSNAAFNAFLKTLEEPPPYAIFILATTEKHKIIPTILSRCQIFDFNRIQISDISNHLSKIAEKEGIKAEPEALHLISQKADGALRDALSIFDLITTFSSDNTITYKSTIENLHILDYDYYFKMTDYLMTEDVSNALLTFDEILKDGFDGHNFIVGVAEHFRDLLVCKDNATVKLLEVSDNVRQKYVEQANAASLSFLMSALSIASAADNNYKNSKNQRLHVELALMKMSFINKAVSLASVEAEKKKPELASSTTVEKKTPSQPAPVKAPVPPVEEVKEGKAPPITEEPEVSYTPKGISNTPKIAPKATVKIPSLNNLSDVMKQDDVKKKEALAEEMLANEDGPRQTDEYTIHDLKRVWNDFGKKAEKEGRISQQLIVKNREITLDDNHTIHLEVDNHVQLESLVEFKEELMRYLRTRLKNTDIQLKATVMEVSDKKMIYTTSEKYNHLAEKYPDLAKMKDKFGLETDY